MNILEQIFDIESHIQKERINIQNHELLNDPWTNDYLPELYVTSETINKNISRLIQCVSKGKCFSAIVGDIKSGKSYLIHLLKQGLRESLFYYSSYNEFFVEIISPADIGDYSLLNLMRVIAQKVLDKYYTTKEEIIVQLKKYITDTNSLLIILLDEFKGETLKKIVLDTSKLLKLLKSHISCILSCHGTEIESCRTIMDATNSTNTTYFTMRIPDFTLAQAKECIKLRMRYGFGKFNFNLDSIFSPKAIESAWVYSNGNPWIFLSIMSDSFSYAKTKGENKIIRSDVESVNELFSRTKVVGERDDKDRFIIQQAINEFPNRERQVCEYLLLRDATAREITIHLYGDLPSDEYRSKYMGTKSFIRRLREKKVVIVKGKEGRSLLFGLNPNIKDFLTEK